ncbi:hypothetical protein BOX15_Mlig005030g1, partial [Macrostomum lignano]
PATAVVSGSNGHRSGASSSASGSSSGPVMNDEQFETMWEQFMESMQRQERERELRQQQGRLGYRPAGQAMDRHHDINNLDIGSLLKGLD